MTRDHPGAAFLDLDHTLIDVDAGMRFAHHMVDTRRAQIQAASGAQARRLRREHRLRMAEIALKAVAFLPLYKARLMRRSTLVRESYRFFRGEDVERIRETIRVFFDKDLRHRLYPGARELIRWHRERGDPTVILTTGPYTAARLFAAELGVDHAVGVRLEHQGGVLTGRVAEGPLWGGDKLEHARRLCAENGWSVGRSFGYSDHASDAVLLAATGHPVAVHPNRRLARLAKKWGWPVLDLRDPQRVRQWLERQASR